MDSNMTVATRRVAQARLHLMQAGNLTPPVKTGEAERRAEYLRLAYIDLRLAARAVSSELRGQRML